MRVIINSPFQATWSERDVKMLKASGYDHHVFHGFANGLLIGAWGILKLMFNRSSRGAVWLHQSAGHASVIPCVFGQFFGQKNIVIAVGADCARFPEINYGLYRKLSTRFTTVLSMKFADLICPVHKRMIGYDYSYCDVKYKRQGVTAFVKGVEGKMFPINNGFSEDKWGCERPLADREVDVLSVFVAGIANRAKLKGADLLLDLAEQNPQWSFRIIGAIGANISVPENCQVISNCTQSQLRAQYNQAKVYVQASMSEGFPNTLAESMACGCFPIGSDVTSLPEIIGEHGLVLRKRDVAQLGDLVQQGLDAIHREEVDPAAISESIFRRFPLQKRTEGLKHAIERVMN